MPTFYAYIRAVLEVPLPNGRKRENAAPFGNECEWMQWWCMFEAWTQVSTITTNDSSMGAISVRFMYMASSRYRPMIGE